MSAASRSLRSILGLTGVAVAMMAATAAPASAALSVDFSLTHDAHDRQALYIDATSGQYRLTVTGADGKETAQTADIAVTGTTLPVAEAQAIVIQDAINLALDSIGPVGDAVSVRAGEPLFDLRPFLITFDGGPMATRRQALIRVRNGTTPPSVGIKGGVPQIYVETHSPGGINRGDERVNYMVTLKNNTPAASSAAVGDVVACDGADRQFQSPATLQALDWTPLGFDPTGYGFQWLRNGLAIPGATSGSYTVAAEDVGAALQCIVKGSNANGASAFASLPGLVIAPASSPEPPGMTLADSNLAASRPTITGTGTAMRTCVTTPNPTNNWNAGGTPVTFTHQWLRNGEPILGATASTYTPDAGPGGADVEKVLQCMVRGTTGTGTAPDGGGLVAISLVSLVGSVPNVPVLGNPSGGITTPRTVVNGAGGVTVELELPSDQSYLAGVAGVGYAANLPRTGWGCTEVPASGANPPKAICSFDSLVFPGVSNSVRIGVGLGPDVPSSGATVEVSATVPGASGPALAGSSTFEVGPKREFGITPGRFSARALDALGEDTTQAGGHPAMATTSISFERVRSKFFGQNPNAPATISRPVEQVRNASGEIPPGFIGNIEAVPDVCPTVADLFANACPPSSVVGELSIQVLGLGFPTTGLAFKPMALFAIEPEEGAPAQFAAIEATNKGVYVLTPKLLPEKGYAIGVEALGITTFLPLVDLRVSFCGYGANFENPGSPIFRSCKRKGDPGAYAKPFWTSQTECAAANPKTIFSMDSWANPGVVKSATALAPKMTGCEQLTSEWEPKLNLQPTSKQAESASGLAVDLDVPSEGLEDPDGLSQAHLKKTTVTLPRGMSVNPSAADGLAACTQAQLGMANGVPNDDPVKCPLASKIGTAKVVTPILGEALEGSVYLAKQGDNPFGTLAALYLVVESKERGILIKLPGRVDFKAGGQIVSTFDENPQAPFSSLELDFHSGPRATVMTPQRCGTYEIVSELTPWSAADPDNPTPAETVTETSSFDVTSGPGGGPCPTGSLEPKMNAGLQNPLAGSSSPFVLRLHREDGTQRFANLEMKLPPGLTANLRGVPYCPDSVLASIPSAEGTGQAEIDNPSCPAASQVGSVSTGAGAGNPYYVNTGKAYLAGPYKGAPLSLAVVVPAVAGPFDLGNVIVRNALRVDPVSAQVTVDADPIPTHVHNIPVDVRDIRVTIDRSDFTLAPTSCEEMQIEATVGGEQGASAKLSNRFQVGECAALGFKPRTSIQLFGGVTRAKYQGVRAIVRPRPGDANISGATVRFPSSAFVAQEHLQNICTRVQWAADACPKNSVYGRAIAYSPLLDEPLTGNLHLRSSSNLLPDLVADLRGPAHQPIRVEVAVRNDSVKGALRNTVSTAPDAPVTYFRMQVFGGKKALIVNSRNICKDANAARVSMRAHNGRRSVQSVPVRNAKCGKWRKAQKRKAAQRKRAAAAKRSAAARRP